MRGNSIQLSSAVHSYSPFQQLTTCGSQFLDLAGQLLSCVQGWKVQAWQCTEQQHANFSQRRQLFPLLCPVRRAVGHIRGTEVPENRGKEDYRHAQLYGDEHEVQEIDPWPHHAVNFHGWYYFWAPAIWNAVQAAILDHLVHRQIHWQPHEGRMYEAVCCELLQDRLCACTGSN